MKNRSPARIAWRFLARQKRSFALALFWRALFVMVPMQVPVLTGALVDGLTHQDVHLYGVRIGGGGAERVPVVLVLGLGGVAVLYGVAAYGQMMASHRLSRGFVTTLRKEVVQRAVHLDLKRFHRYGTGDLIDRIVTDTANLRRFMERVCVQTLINVLRIAYPIGMLLWIEPLMAIVVLSVLPPQWVITRWLQQRLHSATQRSRRSQADLTGHVKERLDGMETIRVHGAEVSSVDKIHQGADNLEANELDASRNSAGISGVVFLTTTLGIGLTWWLGGGRVIAGEMTLGTLILFTGFVGFAYQPFRQFTTMLTTYRRGLVSLQRIGELLDGEPPTACHGTTGPLRVTEGRVELRGVSFRYGRRRVLDDVDLVIQPRQLTVLTGPSGSGKSSLLRLICRLYDPCRGQVLIDGTDLRAVDLSSLRSCVAVVPQHPVLFSGTVRENISLARPDAQLSDVVEACEKAGAMEFIDRLDGRFEARLGRAGVNLSGGQAQRLSIARALLSQPAVLLLDEPTSALDTASESAIVETLRRISEQATVVVVGHRGRVIRSADRTVLVDAGRIVKGGTGVSRRRESRDHLRLVPALSGEVA